MLHKQPAAIQQRYVETLVEIGTEKKATIVFPLPIDIFSSLDRALNKFAAPEKHEEGTSGAGRV